MEVKQQPAKWQKWNSFVSLKWYDSLIEFIFRFVAKTSEPLLALGIVYSAADILSKGHLGGHNQTLADLWALTQAVAIESSGGVVLVYGLQSLKERDKVKARLYFILSGLLAVAGGIMLFMQLAGWETQQNDSTFMLALFALRCVVSVGYIYLCRTKHIRFLDLADVKEDVRQEDILSALTKQVQVLAENMLQVTSTVTEVKTTVTEITAAHLPIVQAPLQLEAPANDGKIDEPIFLERFQSKEQVIAAILQRTPDARPEQVAREANCSLRTAQKWMSRVQIVP